MDIYLTNLTKSRIVKEDFSEEVIHCLKAKGRDWQNWRWAEKKDQSVERPGAQRDVQDAWLGLEGRPGTEQGCLGAAVTGKVSKISEGPLEQEKKLLRR